MSGSERTRRWLPMHNLPIAGDMMAAYLGAVAADLDSLAARLDGVIDVVTDLTKRCERTEGILAARVAALEKKLERIGETSPDTGTAAGETPAVNGPSAPPPADDEEIVEAIARVVYRVEMDCEESAATADEEGVAVARAVLAALRARGSVIR